MRKPLSVAIVKPVNGKCNLRCDYCYMQHILEPQKSNSTLMDLKTLQATIDFFCSHQEEIEFIWHGGEPLLAEKEFYYNAVEFQKVWLARGKKIVNFLQTNGSLIDENWAITLSQLGFCVGVSFDAPMDVQNKLRKTTAEAPCAKNVLKGISWLKEQKIFNGVSCCIGKMNFSRPKETLNLFLDYDIKNLKFLQIKSNGQNVAEKSQAITANEYTDFLIEIFKLWLELDDVDLEIRDIRGIVDIMLGGNFRECASMGRCDQFVTVYSDGSIYACDSFPNEPQFKFGTVFEPYQIAHSTNCLNKFLEKQKEMVTLCQNCQWYFICRGGCFRERSYQNNQSQVQSCEAKQRLFSTVKNTLVNYGLIANKP